MAAPCGVVVMKKSEAGRSSVPFRNQTLVFWLRAKAVADEICLSRDYGIGFTLILRQAADKVENQRRVMGRGFADGKHSLEVTAKDARGAKRSVLSIWYLAASPRRCLEGRCLES